MRTKKAFYNTISGLIYQFIAIICAFILPRLILETFGSTYNGIVSSINQFLSWISVLSAGVGGVTRAALYKPLSDEDIQEISSIIKATDNFMKKVALIFLAALLIFSVTYPIIIHSEFKFSFVFSLVLVLGINTFTQYYFGITYRNLLEADQRQYIYTIVRITTTIVGTFIAVLLIKLSFDIRLVYFFSSIVYSCNPIFLNFFVKKYYKLDLNAVPNYTSINQRWNAFAQELAIMINSNTDLVVLTIFTDLKIVSVYVIYNMIINGVKQLLQTFTTGVGAAFGNMIAENLDNSYLDKSLKLFEFIVINITTILFSLTAMTIVPFVSVYARGINDVNYIRYNFGILITIAAMFNCYRIPYQTIVYAAGKFKETRDGSIIEASINILSSIILVIKLGLIGVVIGTLIAAIFRTFQYAIYLSDNLIVRKRSIFIINIIISLLIFYLSICIFNRYFVVHVSNYVDWILLAIKSFFVVIVPMIIVDILLFRSELKDFIVKLKNLVSR